MSETHEVKSTTFWLFHEKVDEELLELRKFIDPEIDLSNLVGIDKLFDRLNHLIE